MKILLIELANGLAFLFFIAAILFLWVGFDDSDIIAFKTSLAGLLP